MCECETFIGKMKETRTAPSVLRHSDKNPFRRLHTHKDKGRATAAAAGCDPNMMGSILECRREDT